MDQERPISLCELEGRDKHLKLYEILMLDDPALKTVLESGTQDEIILYLLRKRRDEPFDDVLRVIKNLRWNQD